MTTVFFLSYAGPDEHDKRQRNAIERFHKDLSANVRALIGLRDEQVGYWDRSGLETGTPNWEEALAKNLAKFPVGVILLSPQYLAADRPSCKWECLYLTARNDWADKQLSNKPRLLMVLNWLKPRPEDIPDDFPKATQIVNESIVRAAPEVQRAVRAVLSRGVRRTTELSSDDDVIRTEYTQFIWALADYIVDQWRRWQGDKRKHNEMPLPPPFSENSVWDSRLTNARSAPNPRPDSLARKKVVTVYIAAQPSQVEDPRAWRYRDDGESDWHAFSGWASPSADDDQRIGEIVNAVPGIEVERLHFNYFADQKHMPDLLKTIGRRYPVVFIIDPWTASQLQVYRDALELCSKLEADHGACTCPIVIWNDDDPEAVQIRTEFERNVRSLFQKYQWEEVKERHEFDACLLGAVERLRRKIRNMRADESSRGGSPLVRISATGPT